ncbi:alpha/beta hydrolase family protein [Gloeobacter kilaueensis]|uniref:alpha/beta hydrolase family protein n=1 Tax=Gloeobacter kilaueensis TaxID=1416614 RepID=UPI000413E631|nr:hypothetical protein [Gloeobacter kilaueensis]
MLERGIVTYQTVHYVRMYCRSVGDAMRRLLAIAIGIIANGLGAVQAEPLGVGFRQLQLKDPVGGGSMQAVVFYPASGRTKPTTVGLYLVDASPETALLGGKHGLIVLSHGSGGGALGHHDLATALAHRGFIVAAVEHPRDNYHDQSGSGTAAVLIARPRQLSALIDADRSPKAAVGPHRCPARRLCIRSPHPG